MDCQKEMNWTESQSGSSSSNVWEEAPGRTTLQHVALREPTKFTETQRGSMGNYQGDGALLAAGPGVQKMYLAIVEEGDRLEDGGFVGPTVRQMQGAAASSSGKQEQGRMSDTEEEELVLTRYTTLARCPEKFALLALQPVTGQPTSAAVP